MDVTSAFAVLGVDAEDRDRVRSCRARERRDRSVLNRLIGDVGVVEGLLDVASAAAINVVGHVLVHVADAAAVDVGCAAVNVAGVGVAPVVAAVVGNGLGDGIAAAVAASVAIVVVAGVGRVAKAADKDGCGGDGSFDHVVL